MARPSKTSQDVAGDALIEQTDGTATDKLSAMLADALAASPIGEAHGALSAIEIALIDLKARAVSVAELLGEEFAPILERIQAL
ncbi:MULTISPECIES: hypothetical protein [unclassified Burkholderia]|uniref:hypothetical protein n=1 Tax=unclassified Burkholderia TaxID=2613784 RepID=UPI000F577671|nr:MULTISPECIES: hypothetical protein [unclassified Burkholderia]RQS29416.1 hypothetical protein DIE05_13510 [Burkholderia sp. Bp8995]RQS47662.1 hypothetical protein DIE00_14090 [Burkholderia sp. Bp8989]